MNALKSKCLGNVHGAISNGVSSSEVSCGGVPEFRKEKCGCALADSVQLSSQIDGSYKVLMVLLTVFYIAA